MGNATACYALQRYPGVYFRAVSTETTMKALMGIVLLSVLCPVVPTASGQDAVPTEILSRTFMIQVGNERGTAFSVDYKGLIYLVTARHMVAGLPAENPTIKIRIKGNWEDFPSKRLLFPSSPKVDIAVFDTGEAAPKPFTIAPMSETSGTTMGQQVWFLGYPLEGLGSHFGAGPNKAMSEAPFIKRGTMSAIDGTDPDAVVVYIDGFNNPGFSGGPIVYWDFNEHAYRIFGVVQGYRTEDAHMMVNGQQLDTNILVNSGILVGYVIRHAMDAIKAAVDAAQPAPAQ